MRIHYWRLQKPTLTQSESRYLAYGCRPRYIGIYCFLKKKKTVVLASDVSGLHFAKLRLSIKTILKAHQTIFFCNSSCSILFIYYYRVVVVSRKSSWFHFGRAATCLDGFPTATPPRLWQCCPDRSCRVLSIGDVARSLAILVSICVTANPALSKQNLVCLAGRARTHPHRLVAANPPPLQPRHPSGPALPI